MGELCKFGERYSAASRTIEMSFHNFTLSFLYELCYSYSDALHQK